MPAPDTECFQIVLEILAKKYPRDFILLFVDGAGNHLSLIDVPIASSKISKTTRKTCNSRLLKLASRTPYRRLVSSTLHWGWTQGSQAPIPIHDRLRPMIVKVRAET
jgi:hypothetical protein